MDVNVFHAESLIFRSEMLWTRRTGCFLMISHEC